MARQLAALPKKQFDLYRTKSFIALKPPPIQVSADKLNLMPYFNNCAIETKLLQKSSVVLEYSPPMIENSRMTENSLMEENVSKVEQTDIRNNNEKTSTKSAAKKKKKSKKHKSASTSITDTSEGGPQKVTHLKALELDNKLVNGNMYNIMEHKLLDADGSRTAKMNKSLVADISTGPVGLFKARPKNSSGCDPSNDAKDHLELSSAQEICKDEKKSHVNNVDDQDINLLNDSILPDQPPFGFPLSADKLITSALGLLSTDTLYSIDPTLPSTSAFTVELSSSPDQSKESCRNDTPMDEKYTDIGDVPAIINSEAKPMEKIVLVKDSNTNYSQETDNPDSQVLDINTEGDSVDGDVSNSSALEDEGWQSQTRRSHRKKKKELAAVRSPRERNRVEQKQRKDVQNNHFQNNTRRQNFRKTHETKNEVVNSVDDQKGCSSDKSKDAEEVTVKPKAEQLCEGPVKNEEDLSTESMSDNSALQVDSKVAFSYRDALLKIKAIKTKDELHYSSDSGVDANSVSSCDSGMPSPDPPKENYNYTQSVSFLMKGWNEIGELKRKGQVTYYNNDGDLYRPRRWQKKAPYKPRNAGMHRQQGARNAAR